MLPRPGDYNRRVAIRVWSDAPNAAFGIDPSFDEGIKRWAKVEPIHSLAIRAGAQTGEVPTHLVFVRWGQGTRADEITATHVVEFNGRRYRVIGTINVDGADVCTRIEVKDIGEI